MSRLASSRLSFLPRLLAVIFIAGVLLAACAPKAGLRQDPEALRIQWPPEPEPASIEWVKVVENYQDAGISTRFWKKVVNALAGGSEPGIVKPYGVYLDRQSRLCVVDSGAAVLHLMDMGNNRYSTVGDGRGQPFRLPIAVTGDDGDHLYITDSAAGYVFRYDLRDRRLVPFVRLQRPTGIAFNGSNRLLYVTDTLSHEVVAFDLDGNERLRIGGRGEEAGEFNYPTDLAIDGEGRLYVTDPLNARIQVFSAEGDFLLTLGVPGIFLKPKGVAVDSLGNIYVADAMLDAVRVFDKTGRFLLEFGSRGSRPGEFWMPSGIFIDGDGLILVADTYNQRVQVFRQVGAFSAGPKP